MSRRQYRFLPHQLEFRRLPRWRALRIGRVFVFLLGIAIGVVGMSYLVLRWRPSPALQAAEERQKREAQRLSALTTYRDTLYRTLQAVDSVERRIYQQLVPSVPTESLTGDTIIRSVPSANVLSEDSLTKYLAKTEQMLRSLMRNEELLNGPELRSPRLPRGLPCECPEIGAGMRELSHPLTAQPQKHDGIDFLVSEGAPVRATAEGLIRSIEGDRPEGAKIIIQHTPNLATAYFPVIPEVQVGQWISMGSIIGRVGRVALARIPVLHYEVLVEDKPTDPFPFLWGAFTLTERNHRRQALMLQPNGLH